MLVFLFIAEQSPEIYVCIYVYYRAHKITKKVGFVLFVTTIIRLIIIMYNAIIRDVIVKITLIIM